MRGTSQLAQAERGPVVPGSRRRLNLAVVWRVAEPLVAGKRFSNVGGRLPPVATVTEGSMLGGTALSALLLLRWQSVNLTLTRGWLTVRLQSSVTPSIRQLCRNGRQTARQEARDADNVSRHEETDRKTMVRK